MGSGSNVEGVRRQNLGTILQLVHHAGPLSRAALTQRTGLNRSTISSSRSQSTGSSTNASRTPRAASAVRRRPSCHRAMSSRSR